METDVIIIQVPFHLNNYHDHLSHPSVRLPLKHGNKMTGKAGDLQLILTISQRLLKLDTSYLAQLLPKA